MAATRGDAGVSQSVAGEAPEPRDKRFACAFTRRNCAHEPLFSDQYKRTNRTKGTKIMRCFPHCCPTHVERSYCGAPVYLQVDLEYTTTTASSVAGYDQADERIIQGEKLQVFGRFRLQDVQGYRVGQKVALGVIHRSLLSEQNPAGEWVSARMLASAGHTAWLFEVNPSAKWFYDWEVGAARNRRAMAHVFEVYVFYERSQQQQPARYSVPNPVSHSQMHNSVQVVAAATSSAFTLVSFRRAAPRGVTVEAAGEVSGLRTGQQQLQEKRSVPRKSLEPPSIGDPHTVAARGKHTGERQDARDDDNDTSYAYDDAPYEDDGEDKARFGSAETLERVEAEEILSPVTIAAKNLALVYWFLNRITLDAFVPFASRMQELLYTSLCNHTARSNLVVDESSSLATDRHLLERVLRQLVASSANSFSRSPVLANAPVDTEDATDALIEMGLKLALWMLLDKENNAEMEKFLQRSAKVLLDRGALVQSYQTWVEWLHERIDDFLYTHGWSLSRLLSGIIAHEADAQWPCGSLASDQDQFNNMLTSDGSESVASGQEVFIAHVRELYIANLRLPLSALHMQLRLQHQSPVMSLTKLIDPSRVSSQQLSGVWLCQFESFSTRSFSLEASARQRDTVMGATSFLWLLRQLTCAHLALTTESSAPVLLIRSVFNPAAGSEDRSTRLVLDQHHHWFRSLPGSESSLASRIGGLSFGDYVGSVVASPGPDVISVEFRCYAWPTVSSYQKFAYCWHLQLTVSSEDPEQLSVSVVVERSESPIADSAGDSSAHVDLNTEVLSNKLSLVQCWVPIRECQVRFRRLDDEVTH